MPESSTGADIPADEPPGEPAEQPEDGEVFTNRAARRAKGKSAAKPEVFAKGQRPVGRGAVQSPRQYGNRRSG